VTGVERSEIVVLFLRLADVLERSADLAQRHAERDRGRGRSDEIELRAASRAREGAARARSIADGM
jgi:hypothetical protein